MNYKQLLCVLLYSDPPLSPSDIPNGEWLCHSCKCTAKGQDRLANMSKTPSPLDTLIFAASLANPREFEMPKEYQSPNPFPGTDKIDSLLVRKAKKDASTSNGT